MFEHVPAYAGDPILSLMEQFQRDERINKVNLSIGLYYDADGRVPQLRAVKAALPDAMAARANAPTLYLPMEGRPGFRKAVGHFLFGAEGLPGERVATIQTLGGSGALKVGADFLRRYLPQSSVWVSDPTWDNHVTLFEGAGFQVHTYPYFDKATLGVDLQGMLDCLATLPAQSIVLLHPCCHNPTGADLTPAQWDQVVEVIQAKQLLPFLDMAYMGMGAGLASDQYLVRALMHTGVRFLLSTSFSKVFSLYGERVGALSLVCRDAEESARVLGQLKATVRRNYSSPPSLGAELVEHVLQSPALMADWLQELDEMRERMSDMRHRLVDALQAALPGYDASALARQQGMFSFTGLTPSQVDTLRDKHGVYMVRSGRLCVAGLNRHNLSAVMEAWVAVARLTS